MALGQLELLLVLWLLELFQINWWVFKLYFYECLHYSPYELSPIVLMGCKFRLFRVGMFCFIFSCWLPSFQQWYVTLKPVEISLSFIILPFPFVFLIVSFTSVDKRCYKSVQEVGKVWLVYSLLLLCACLISNNLHAILNFHIWVCN